MEPTRFTRHIRAPRAIVYRTLLDPQAVAKWKVPNGMTCQVHKFEAHEGGLIRVSLTYENSSQTGKTSERTDTYHGPFTSGGGRSF